MATSYQVACKAAAKVKVDYERIEPVLVTIEVIMLSCNTLLLINSYSNFEHSLLFCNIEFCSLPLFVPYPG